MKSFLTIVSMILIFGSCNSNKPKDETKATSNKDTATVQNPLSTDTLKDSSVIDPDLSYVGDLFLGLGHSKVLIQLGQPESKDKAIEWGADGMTHQNWFYKASGIMLNMESNKSLDEQSISSITITSPCTFRTKKNIGIGSTYQEVIAAYQKDIDNSSSDKTKIVVGSIYGGIIIDFNNDKAESIFIGAAAE